LSRERGHSLREEGHSLRERGCRERRLFIEGGRRPFIEGGGRLFIERCSRLSMWREGRTMDFHIRKLHDHMLEFEWTATNCSSPLDIVHSPVAILSQHLRHCQN